jgi:hypothetical protein
MGDGLGELDVAGFARLVCRFTVGKAILRNVVRQANGNVRRMRVHCHFGAGRFFKAEHPHLAIFVLDLHGPGWRDFHDILAGQQRGSQTEEDTSDSNVHVVMLLCETSANNRCQRYHNKTMASFI